MDEENQFIDEFHVIEANLPQGFGNFSSLVDSPAIPAGQVIYNNDNVLPAYQHAQENFDNQSNFVQSNDLQIDHQRYQEQQFYQGGQDAHSYAWDAVDGSSDIGTAGIGDGSSAPELYSHHPLVPGVTNPVPSLQPWEGLYKFKASFVTDNKDKNNKWCYSPNLKRLYVVPDIAVPCNISLEWNPDVEANVRITPVFKQSQHIRSPVHRCYNCKTKTKGNPVANDHIVQMDSSQCHYEVLPDERCVVTIPLLHPPPGESHSTILFRIMCLTSCVGGPNRRPFCLMLTLHCSKSGREIGRQILDVKCCKCPHRDMGNDEKNFARTTVTTVTNTTTDTKDLDEKLGDKVKKIASEITMRPKKRKVSTTGLEPQLLPGFVNMLIPVEFEQQVKKFVNSLIAARHLKQHAPNLMLYSEPDSDATD